MCIQIKGAAVVMISKSYCPYCKSAHDVLKKYAADGETMNKIEIDNMANNKMAAIQAYCKQVTGASSVPRVWIGGELVGGCDDTKALEAKGELKGKIEAAIAAQK